MKKVLDSDIKNKSLDNLPIRRGCRAGICFCLGICLNVEGMIKRAEYEAAIAAGVDMGKFLEQKVSQKAIANEKESI